MCSNPSAFTQVSDGEAADDSAGQEFANAIATACRWSAPAMVSQNGPNQDGSTGRPLLGSGYTMAMAGGPFFQKALGYLDNAGAASEVYFTSTATTFSFVRRDTGAVLVSVASAQLSAHHDFFIVELVMDPSSGTLVAAAYGFEPPGTAAAAWYASHTILPALAQATFTWVVGEWTDKDSDSLPSAGDTFSIVAQQ